MENNNEPIMINGEPVYTNNNPIPPEEPKYEKIPEPSLPYNVNSYPKPKKNEYGLISMICGILGIMFMGLFPFSPGLGVAAVILANKSDDEEEATYKSVGKITGIISIILSAIGLLLFVGIIILAIAESTYY